MPFTESNTVKNRKLMAVILKLIITFQITAIFHFTIEPGDYRSQTRINNPFSDFASHILSLRQILSARFLRIPLRLGFHLRLILHAKHGNIIKLRCLSHERIDILLYFRQNF